MRAVDTNVLVRLLVDDDASQATRATRALRVAEERGEPLYVPSLVLLELIWVLESAYGCTRAEVLDAILSLTAMQALVIDHLDAVHRMVELATTSRQGLADLLIGCCAVADGCDSVLTFDQKAARSPLFERL